MRHPAGKEDLNDRFGNAFAGLIVFLSSLRFHFKELRESESKSAKEADLKESASGVIAGEGVSGARFFHRVVRLGFFLRWDGFYLII